MTNPKENETLNLLEPPPDVRLFGWLEEFYGKKVKIKRRDLLRHRDLSYVERITFEEALPESLIYKLVLPPWDIEQDLHERILIPSIAASAQLYMSAHVGPVTAMFLEDMGTTYLKEQGNKEQARKLGEEIARMHRAYSYRIDEIIGMGVLRSLTPIDFEAFSESIAEALSGWGVLKEGQANTLLKGTATIAHKLAGQPITLVHGDLYAENVVCRGERLYIIDWSWFTMISVPMIDLASLVSDHPKNGTLRPWKDELIEAYCFESGGKTEDLRENLPYASTLERILFLNWLVERKNRGITGTTVGPVENLMESVVEDICNRSNSLT